ncbi:MAG: trimethylamine methyltransferase family protein [Spirochaetales bacterium]|nr:trimethylamine methyltransferase family protein [Spirochaetales bacterium]
MRIGTQFQQGPGLDWMSPDQCEEIYLAALEVLDRVGVRVHEPRALALLQAAGARLEGDRARLPAGLVQQALAGGMASSMEMVLLCSETAGTVRRILQGLPMDARSLALETIEAVGPGGNYVAEEHTVEGFRQSLHRSELANRGAWDRWQAAGGLEFGERARRRAREILEGYRCPALPARVRGRLREIACRGTGAQGGTAAPERAQAVEE